MKRHLLLSLASLCIISHLSAQWGIRGTVLHWERYSPRGQWNLLFGVEHDLNDRLSIALEYTKSLDLFGTGDFMYDGNGEYSLERNASGITYRSAYFLSGNDDGQAVYVGPFVGFRTIKYTMGATEYLNAYPYTVTTSATGDGMLFPIGLRAGWRSPLDGYIGDIYVSIGTLLGDKDLVKSTLLGPKDIIGGPYIQIGYALGFGW